MRTMTRLGIFLVFMLVLAACQPASIPIETPAETPAESPEQPAASMMDLAGTSWTLSALDGNLPLPGVQVTLEFGADGTASGTDGCNRFSTTYTQDGASLTITQPMASTMMACEDAVMTQASAYMAALAATNGFLGGDRQLVLTDGDQFLATFVAGIAEAGSDAGGETTEAPPVVAGQLAGTNWTMSALVGTMPLEGTSVTLAFGADGSVSGSDGCNNFSTTYTEDGSSLTINQPMASTMMACEDAVMAQGAAVMAALTTATDFSIAEDQLTLSAGGETLATFTAVSSDLTDTAWDVVNYNNGREAVVGLLEGTEITAYFGADGTVTGNASCNQYFASYATDGDTITIGQPGSTMMFCGEPEGVMDQESEYLAALQSAATYSISGDMLQMRTAEDALAIVMVRREIVDLPEPEPAVPTGVVTGAQALNIRSGPGTNFPVVGVARNGDSGEIIGRSADGNWWVVSVPSAPGGMGWVSASFVTATGADEVPVIASPPPPPTPTPMPATPTPAPAPTATPLPLATPITEIAFWLNQTTIEQGQCTTLNWSVQNVQAVWVYPQGEIYNRFPRTGQGNEVVCPPSTTTYEMRVQMRDGTTQIRQVTLNVNPAPPPPAVNSLSGTRWDVVNYNNGRQAVSTLVDGTSINMNFGTDGQVTGTAGCNNYFAFYQVNGSNLTIGQPGSTSRFCVEPEGVMDQESAFLAALHSAATFNINGNMLEIRTAGDAIAVIASRAP